MKKTWYSGILFYFVAPVVMIGAIIALALTGFATYENYRLGQATDQIIRIVSLARDLRVAKDIPSDKASLIFYERLRQISPAEVVEVSSQFLGDRPEQGLLNPWGEVLRVFFYPSANSLRLETQLSSAACRRMLSFYAKDVGSLGVRRIDVRNADAGSVWRMVYQEQGGILSPHAIYGGCGDDVQDVLSLTFYL
ncbi:MAG: hypothetical protein PHD48_02115 [Alphaproteobacteria bacterium]|nr:hypothetical protein [Alphaproteobacteria bacterium]